jgi:hypothetical protein
MDFELKVKEWVTKKPAVATPDMGLTQIARRMAEQIDSFTYHSGQKKEAIR